MAQPKLVIRAGQAAADRLRAEGFHRELFGTLVGASGGPKWLVLRHLDTVLADRLIAERETPIDTLGSSIGSFRHACFAQSNPHSALERFERGYVEQRYDGPGRPQMADISRESDRILGLLLGEKGAIEVAQNPIVRSHFIAARLIRDAGRDRGLGFQLQLAGAAIENAFARSRLQRHFERILFRPADSAIAFDDFPTLDVALTPERVQHGLLASGTIPMVMEGVRTTPGVDGVLFDGGILDYHYDFEFARDDRLVLYPHFFDRIVPGWFDKPLKWRRPSAAALDDVVFLAPSDEFVASLPGGKVPDRNDFLNLETEERIKTWGVVLERGRELADELVELIDGGRIADSIEPFWNA